MPKKRHVDRRRVPAPLVGLWLLVAVTTGLVGSLDFLTGPDVYLTVLYLVPILVLGWFVGLRAAIGLTVAVMLYRAGLYATVWAGWRPGRVVAAWNLVSESGFIALILVVTARWRRAVQTARRLALTDDLTGTANRRAFYRQASRALEQARTTHRPLSLAYLDADDFKLVNDRLGHQKGDQVLATIGRALRAAARPGDLAARLGGDEFALLMPDTDAVTAHRQAVACRESLLAVMQDDELPVTFSIGVLTCLDPPASPDDLIAGADALLYAAKGRGKNVLVPASPGPGGQAA